MEDFKKAVLDRIEWTKRDIEESISKRDETLFDMYLGKLQAYYGLAQHCGFMDEDSLAALLRFKESCIDRFFDQKEVELQSKP